MLSINKIAIHSNKVMIISFRIVLVFEILEALPACPTTGTMVLATGMTKRPAW